MQPTHTPGDEASRVGRCDCYAEVNARLAEHNGRLATGFLIRGDMSVGLRLLIQTEKINDRKRKKVPHVTASFCPFCGTKWEHS